MWKWHFRNNSQSFVFLLFQLSLFRTEQTYQTQSKHKNKEHFYKYKKNIKKNKVNLNELILQKNFFSKFLNHLYED